MRVSATYECGHTTSSEYSHSPGEYRAEAHSGNCSACLKPSAEAAQEAISVTADQATARVKQLTQALAWIGQQFCARRPNDPGLVRVWSPCTETEMCITEYCLPCYAKSALREHMEKQNADS